MRLREKALWSVVIFLALLTSLAAIHRLAVMKETTADAFDVRYTQHPELSYFHLLPGLIFMALGPLQFSKRIRAKYLNLHRWTGRVFLIAGLAAAIFGMALAFRLPAFGGPGEAAATYLFGAGFVFCVVKAYYHVRRKEILLHREWMIRGFAIGLGVSLIRVVVVLLMMMLPLRPTEVFDIAFWVAWSISVITAEIWINQTRARLHANA